MARSNNERLRTVDAAPVVFGIHVFVALPLFPVAYTKQMGSIEASPISLAGYIQEAEMPDLAMGLFEWQ
jgi:hypothetical protein